MFVVFFIFLLTTRGEMCFDRKIHDSPTSICESDLSLTCVQPVGAPYPNCFEPNRVRTFPPLNGTNPGRKNVRCTEKVQGATAEVCNNCRYSYNFTGQCSLIPVSFSCGYSLQGVEFTCAGTDNRVFICDPDSTCSGGWCQKPLTGPAGQFETGPIIDSIECDGNQAYKDLFVNFPELVDVNSNCYCTNVEFDQIAETLSEGFWTNQEYVEVKVGFKAGVYTQPSFNPFPFGRSILTTNSIFIPSNNVFARSTYTDDLSPQAKRIMASHKRSIFKRDVNDTTVVTTPVPATIPPLQELQFEMETETDIFLNGNVLLVVTTQPANTTLLVTKDGVSLFYGCSKPQCYNVLSDNYFINPGSVLVKVYISDRLDNAVSLPVVSFIRCNVPRCVFCSEMYHDFQCYPWQIQTIAVLAIVLLILGGLALILVIIRGTLMFTCCTDCRRKVKAKLRVQKKPAPEDEQRISMSDSVFVLCILFCIPVAGAASCTNGINIGSQNAECTVSGDKQSCYINFQQVVSIAAPGLTSCLSFVDNNGSPIGELEITYEEMVEVSPLQHLYYTAEWQGYSDSKKVCNMQTGCGTCAQYNPVLDPLACFGTSSCHGNPYLLPWQGESRCDNQCGCAGCGCIICDASCVFSRAVIVPLVSEQFPACQVMRPISTHLQPKISAVFRTESSTEAYNITILNNEQRIGQNFTVSVVGTLAGSTNNFAGQNFVLCDDGSVTLGATSNVNAPVVGSFGDIQASQISDFSAYGTYLFAAGLFTAMPGSSFTGYLFQSAGFHARQTHDTIPTIRGATLYTVSDNNVYGLNSNPGAVLLTIDTEIPVEITRTVNVVCPVIDSYTITGCYACDQGATITLFARSACSGGRAAVTSTNFITNTKSIVLTSELKAFEIGIGASYSKVDGTLTLTAGDYNAMTDIEGILVAENLVVVGNNTFSNGRGDAGIGAIPFEDWWNSLQDVWKGLIITGAIIAAVIVAIVSIVIIFKATRAYKAWNLDNKINKMEMDKKKSLLSGKSKY